MTRCLLQRPRALQHALPRTISSTRPTAPAGAAVASSGSRARRTFETCVLPFQAQRKGAGPTARDRLLSMASPSRQHAPRARAPDRRRVVSEHVVSRMPWAAFVLRLALVRVATKPGATAEAVTEVALQLRTSPVPTVPGVGEYDLRRVGDARRVELVAGGVEHRFQVPEVRRVGDDLGGDHERTPGPRRGPEPAEHRGVSFIFQLAAQGMGAAGANVERCSACGARAPLDDRGHCRKCVQAAVTRAAVLDSFDLGVGLCLEASIEESGCARAGPGGRRDRGGADPRFRGQAPRAPTAASSGPSPRALDDEELTPDAPAK
jgi:hypothetical protein